MRKGLIAILALTLVLGFVGYTVAQQETQNPCGGGHMMGQAHMGRHHMGPMGGQGMMGQGMGTPQRSWVP
jgi:Spy/CpxP family protein refolding chaperone